MICFFDMSNYFNFQIKFAKTVLLYEKCSCKFFCLGALAHFYIHFEKQQYYCRYNCNWIKLSVNFQFNKFGIAKKWPDERREGNGTETVKCVISSFSLFSLAV